jgi:hypothetical protein
LSILFGLPLVALEDLLFHRDDGSVRMRALERLRGMHMGVMVMMLGATGVRRAAASIAHIK